MAIASPAAIPIAAIRDGVAKGDFTAVEVAEAFNARVAAAQAALNAFIVATPEKAIEAAKAVNRRLKQNPRPRNNLRLRNNPSLRGRQSLSLRHR